MPKLPELVSEAGYESRLSIYNQVEGNINKKILKTIYMR